MHGDHDEARRAGARCAAAGTDRGRHQSSEYTQITRVQKGAGNEAMNSAALRGEGCPGCGESFDLRWNFCVNCRYLLRVRCHHCRGRVRLRHVCQREGGL